MTTSRFSSAWMPAIAGPALVAVVAGAVALGPRTLSARFWPTPDTNIAEAAVMRDTARVRRLALHGAPLDRQYPIRPGLAGTGTLRLTVTEAADRSGSEVMIRVVKEILAGQAPSE